MPTPEPTIIDPHPSELKPCPFCGSPAAFEHDNDSAGQWHVFCRDKTLLEGCVLGLVTTDGYPRRLDAALAWNHRSLTP